jgi:hypothetical protein
LHFKFSYAIMPIGNEMNGLQSQQKPHELQLVGLSVPFGQGGLNLRLAASYFLPSSHLQI